MVKSEVWVFFIFGNFCGGFLVGYSNELIQAIGISILIGCSFLTGLSMPKQKKGSKKGKWGKLLVGGNSYGS